MRQRAAIVGKVLSYLPETGVLGKIRLRGRENIQKRCPFHVFAYNLSVPVLTITGFGGPRSAAGLRTLLSPLFVYHFTAALGGLLPLEQE